MFIECVIFTFIECVIYRNGSITTEHSKKNHTEMHKPKINNFFYQKSTMVNFTHILSFLEEIKKFPKIEENQQRIEKIYVR